MTINYEWLGYKIMSLFSDKIISSDQHYQSGLIRKLAYHDEDIMENEMEQLLFAILFQFGQFGSADGMQ